MKLRKTVDGKYTLKEEDEKGRKTKDSHYKFVRIRDVKISEEKDNN